MLHTIDFAILFSLITLFIAAAALATKCIAHFIYEAGSLKRGVSTGKKGDFYWLNFPRH